MQKNTRKECIQINVYLLVDLYREKLQKKIESQNDLIDNFLFAKQKIHS